MPKPRQVTIAQLTCLINIIEQNKDIASGRPANTLRDSKELKNFWKNVAVTLNAIPGGIKRTPLKWRIYWSECKYRARVRRKRLMNGGKPLLKFEEHILKISEENQCVHNNPSIKTEVVRVPIIVRSDPLQSNLPSSPSSPKETEWVTENTISIKSSPEYTTECIIPDNKETTQTNRIYISETHGETSAAQNSNTNQEIQEEEPKISDTQPATDPLIWIQQYEERRLAVDSQRARALNRLAVAVENNTRRVVSKLDAIATAVENINNTSEVLERIAVALENRPTLILE